MSNKFPIEITATDKTGKVFEKVGKNGEKLNKKFKGFRALSSLGQDLGKSAGGKVIGAGSRALESLSSGNVMQFAGATGLALGGVTALIGSLSALALSVANRATGIKNMVARTGMTSGSLQDLQGAGKTLGIDEGTTGGAMSVFASTVHEASNGYPSEARDAFLRAGITFKKMPDGSPDVAQALKDYADFVKRQPSATTRAKVADRVGLGDLLPLLQNGSQGLDSAISQGRAARPALTPEEIEKAAAADRKKNAVEMRLKRAGDRIGLGVIDEVDDALENPTNLLTMGPVPFAARRIRALMSERAEEKKRADANYTPSSFDAGKDWLTERPAGAAPAPGVAASQPLDSQVMTDAVREGMLAAMREGTIKVDPQHKVRQPGPPLRSDYTGRPW